MPGLLGYWTETKEKPLPELLAALADTMQHQPGLKVETAFYPGFGAGRVHLGYFQPGAQPAIDELGRFSLWLDGEFNNAADLIRLYDLERMDVQEQARLALALYRKEGWEFLRNVDGLFNIALYDRETHLLTLVNDRYGLRPLYWVKTPNGLAYAGEVKALLGVPDVQVQIEPQAVEEWFSFGYLLGNRTWIRGIELYPPATIAQVSAEGVKTQRYWSWHDIQPQCEEVSEEDIVEELGRLWIQAVEKRVDDHKIGVSLSGGLDSRSVLAAIPLNSVSLHAITFGIEGFDESIIAAQAARIRSTPHSFVEINKDNWIFSRIPAIWQTDGLARILDIHGVEALPVYHEHIDVDIQSFAGDLILGGSYLNESFIRNWSGSFPLVFDKMWLESPLVSSLKASSLLERVFLSYTNLPHSDFFFLDARVRRFTNCGTIMLRSTTERRFPTYDQNLIDFVYSLKDELRLNNRIYEQMLLMHFPEYYLGIPWQKTGLPIGASKWRYKLCDVERFGKRALRYAGRRVGVSLPTSRRGYTDYPTWMRVEPARNTITRLLLSSAPLYADYIDLKIAQGLVKDFLQKNDNRFLTTVGMMLTFEIYLRQLFDIDNGILGE